MFGRIFLSKFLWIQKIVSWPKLQKKLKNDVLEIALEQWNERVRPWSANDIRLFAFFPRAMLLRLESLLYIESAVKLMKRSAAFKIRTAS